MVRGWLAWGGRRARSLGSDMLARGIVVAPTLTGARAAQLAPRARAAPAALRSAAPCNRAPDSRLHRVARIAAADVARVARASCEGAAVCFGGESGRRARACLSQGRARDGRPTPTMAQQLC